VISKIQPKIRRHLVIATATGAQFATEGAKPLDEPSLDRRVNVFILGSRLELSRQNLCKQVNKCAVNLSEFVHSEQTSTVQNTCVRLSLADVVGGQTPIKMDRSR
jgi:hypothetical protein